MPVKDSPTTIYCRMMENQQSGGGDVELINRQSLSIIGANDDDDDDDYDIQPRELFQDEEVEEVVGEEPIRTRRRGIIISAVCQKILLCLIIMFIVHFFTVDYICGAQYFWRDRGSWIVNLCQPIDNYGWMWQIQRRHAGFPMWPPTILLITLLCLIPTILLMLYPSSLLLPNNNDTRKRPFLTRQRRRGDPTIRYWAIGLLVVPTLVILALVSGRPIPSKTQKLLVKMGYADDPLVVILTKLIVKYANVTGYCATVCLSLFLVPVSKQSPLLQALGLSPALAVGFHIWCGRLCWILITLHGLLYVIDQPFFNTDGYHTTFLQKAIYELLPSETQCWKWESPWQFLIADKKDHCYRPWRNFTGILSGLSLFLLVMTSWNWIRRNYYRIFYISHIILGTLMLFFAILHFYWIGVYLLPGLLYYMACSFPVLFRAFSNDILVREATIIPNSNGCYEVKLASSIGISTGGSSTPQQQHICYPAYVRLCIPEIGGRLLWYPFTVAHPIANGGNDLCFLIRASNGEGFTKKLQQRIIANNNDKEQSSFPRVHVDTLYWGADWFSEIRQHDDSLLIAGGIGITPIISVLLHMLQSDHSLDETSGISNNIHVHWYCREKALVQYVLEKYLQPVLDQMERAETDPSTGIRRRAKVEFTIHLTSQDHGNKKETDVEPQKIRPSVSSNGMPFEGTTRSLRMLIGATLVATTTLHLIWYNLVTWNIRNRIFFRAYILYASIFIIVAGTCLVEASRRHRRRRQVEGQQLQLVPTKDEDEEDVVMISSTTTKAITECWNGTSTSKTTQGTWQTKVYDFSCKVSNGRPILEDVIHPVVESTNPAVFYCGPDSLWQHVSGKIRQERKGKHGIFAHLAFFKEHFEL